MTFRYPGAPTPALSGLDLEVPAGALVGVTDPVGSGKSALARVILGLYPLESGTVLVSGRPLAELSGGERARVIGYLPQDPFLFYRTLQIPSEVIKPVKTWAPTPTESR
ncbi:MAG: ATP-binding cassette domain-containing protein [Candidatus Rokuibacteriota bacterium]